MKWAIVRILIAVVLAFQFQIATWLWPQNATPAYATQETATVTLTYRVIVSIGPASGLTLTDLGFITVNANWTAGDNATYHMLRGSRTAYPTTITEGELLYYDTATSCNISGVPLDTITMYASLWAFQADNITHSPVYVTASIGGEGMESIANSITELSNSMGGISGLSDSMGAIGTVLGALIYLIPLIVFSILAFWKENHIFFIIIFGISMVTGLNAPDIISGESETSNIGLMLGLILIFYSFFSMAMALKLMFWRRDSE